MREAAAQGAKIICLPELFVTGYNLGVFGDKLYDMAEGLSGPTITALRAQAKELGVYIIAPIALQVYTTRPLNNAAVLINDEGEVQGVYSKKPPVWRRVRLFHAHGRIPRVRDEVRPYRHDDMRRQQPPEPARILALKGAEVVFMPAAWRVQEADIWPLLIRCHALENNVFLAVANMYCKMDDLFLFGHSMVAGPRGEVLEELTQEAGGVIVQTLDLDEIAQRRATMPSLKDRHPEDYGVFCAPVKAEY